MLLHLTDLSDEPLQGQIVRQIRAKILAGDLGQGDGLPSIRSLARTLRVSVITVQRAYEFLDREGLIHSRRGKGFFVTALTDANKKAMARRILEERLTPVLLDSASEGLTREDILSLLEELFRKYRVV